MMISNAPKSFLIDTSSARFYQQLIAKTVNYEALGNHILSHIKTAYVFRRVGRVKKLAEILIQLPIKEYRLIAQYHLVWCEARECRYRDRDLENIAVQTKTFKAKAISTRATFEWYRGRNENALYFYNEALKASPTVSEYIDISRAIAVIKSQEGFHKNAVRDLERLLPVIRYAEPLAYYEFLNSYAIELGEIGRIDEADTACRIVIASPFASYYDEFRETSAEIIERGRRASRAIVAVSRAVKETEAGNVLHGRFPSVEESRNPVSANGAGDVASLEEWKTYMAKAKQKAGPQKTNKQLVRDMLELMTKTKLSRDQIERIIAIVQESKPKGTS